MSESKGSFSKWKDKINKKVNTIGSKTSYAMDRSKARKQITQIQEEIVVVKQEIGDIVHKNHNNDFTLELVKAQLTQIEEKEASIAQLEAYIEELNELSRLADLEDEEGTANTFESANIAPNESQQPFVGEIVEAEQEALTTQQFTCSKCKQSYEEPKKFCKKCGHKMVG